ncbi:MAG: tRNA (cytidine32/uridine32-2'-O)-methyltransferase [Gammaproteobacteria bacterium]|jgi:tRNA (cytidine32/uridine32-2'-O)-methyltransferase
MNSIISNVRIVLVGTTHPGNIGAAARAMKTMSQDNLYLVNPKEFPSAVATARAAGADDILANASIHDDLKSAISDCELVIATSARTRSIPWPMVSPRECAAKAAESNGGNVAIVFGRENSGLSNEEMELGNLVLQIPTNADYSSLNLASAVQIICYELFLKRNVNEDVDVIKEDKVPLVSQEKIEMFYDHLEECMIEIGYHDVNYPRRLMHRMRRLFNRAQLDESEWKIMRGFLAKIQEKKK